MSKQLWIARCGWCGEEKEVYAYEEDEDEKGDVVAIPQCKECYDALRGDSR